MVLAFPFSHTEVRFGVVAYGNRTTVEFFLNAHNDTDDYLAAIDQIQWRDQATNTSDGIRIMHSVMFTEANGDRPGMPNIGIVVTDGASSRDSDLTIPEADIARHKGIKRVI